MRPLDAPRRGSSSARPGARACPGPGAGTKARRRAARRLASTPEPLEPGGGEHERVDLARRRACAAACRRCRAARRPRGRAATASSCARRRSALVPDPRALAARASSAGAPTSTSRGSARGGAAAISRCPSASSPGTSLAECTARSISPASSAASSAPTQRDLSPRARSTSPAVVIVDELDVAAEQRAPPRAPAPAPARCRGCRSAARVNARRSGRTSAALGRSAAAALVEPEQLAQELQARVAVLGARARCTRTRRLVQQPLDDRARRAPRRARGRARSATPSGPRSRPAARRRRVAARAQRGQRRQHLERARASPRTPGSPPRRCPRRGAPRPGARMRCARPGACSAVDVEQRHARQLARTSGSMSRGTARSISSSGRPPRASHDQRRAPRRRRSRAARRSRRPRCRRARARPGSASNETEPPPKRCASAIARSRRRLATNIVVTPCVVQRPRGQLGGLAGADDQHVAAREVAERVARERRPRPRRRWRGRRRSRSRVRTRLPVASAARNSLLVSGPVVRAASAGS